MSDKCINQNEISDKDKENQEKNNENDEEEFLGEFNKEFFTKENEQKENENKNIEVNKNERENIDEDYENGEHKVLSYLPSDLCNIINSNPKNEDEITVENNDFYLNENNADDSDQEDLILIQEEQTAPNKGLYHLSKGSFNEISSGLQNMQINPKMNANFNYIREDENMLRIKEQMNLSKQSIPKVQSYNLHEKYNFSNRISSNPSLASIGANSLSPPSAHNERPSSYNNSPLPYNFSNSTNHLNTFNFPVNSFSMNGKEGWVCIECKNFNYEMRTKCNRCGRPHNFYQNNFNSHGNLHQMELSGNFSSNNFFTNTKGSQMNLGNPYQNMGFPNSMQTAINTQFGRQTFQGQRNKKPFIEREGDWICSKCNNLNFAFRTCCNRCHLPKDEIMFRKTSANSGGE